MNFLYARTQYRFGLIGGGQVGHTAGVIKGMGQLGSVRVLTNDTLPGVDPDICKLVQPVLTSAMPIGEMLYNVRFAEALRSEIAASRPDFTYTRIANLSVATARVSKQQGIPFVAEFNSPKKILLAKAEVDGIARKLAGPVINRLAVRAELYNLRSAALVVTVSEKYRNYLESEGIPGEKILVNPNAVDVDVFQQKGPEVCRAVRSELGLREGVPVVGFAGTFRPRNGVSILRDVIIRVNADRRNLSRVHFVLFGDGDQFEAIERELGPFQNVTLAGTVPYERMPEYLSVCDVCVSPHNVHLIVGSPTKLFEYMAMGKAIVATRVQTVELAIADGTTGYLSEPGDIHGMAERILYLVDHPEERARLGANARAEVAAKYTWKHNVQNVVDKLEALGHV